MENFKKLLHKALPSLAAVAVFYAVSALCYAPQFEGKVLPQHDVQQFDGMSRDIREHRAAHGEDPQWTGAMFGGMPAYLINIRYPAQILKRSADTLLGAVAQPAGLLFFAMLAAWLMAVMMGISPWVGIVVGLAYGLSTYFMLIINAGHVTKMWALVYAPAMMGAIWMTLRGRMLAGGALTALFASLEVGANHPQITYYFVLAALALWASDLVFAVRERRLPDFAKRTGVLAIAAMLALGSNFSPLHYTARHTSETIRGGSEIAASDNGGGQKGLDLQYATAWSYGLAESWNMLVPDLMGGSSSRTFENDGPVAESMRDIGLSGYAEYLPAYWGDQPYTAGPTYLGAVAIFFALLGVLLADARNRWWLIAVSVLCIMLSWGNNAMWFTELCFKYLPLYNKFRTVSMALVVVEWSVPLLAGYGLWQLWQGGEDKKRILRAAAWSAGITGCIALLFAVAGPSLFDFARERSGAMMSGEFYHMLKESGADDYIRSGVHDELGYAVADAMVLERGEILQADAWRSLAFVVLGAAAVLLFAFGKIRRGWLVAAAAVLVTADLLPVNLRYAPHSAFMPGRKLAKAVEPTVADRLIMEDRESGYRVLNLAVSPFNDASTSLYHRSVGGYHGAKLGRYQDVIDRWLTEGNEAVLDMLNTKYVITPEVQAVARPTANGAAWFVGSVSTAKSAREELEMLGTRNLKVTAVVAAADVPATERFGSGEIELVDYRPNYQRYDYSADGDAVAVFSEIYYADGWKMYVDGEESPCFRADYILRAAELPAGEHTVEWRFRAPMWGVSEAVTLACSIAIIAILALTVIYCIRHEKKRCGTPKQSA